jgi:dihydrofolate reductase
MKVFIIVAMSADGCIGIDSTHLATTWTTKADKQFFMRRSKQAGTVVMGLKTFNTFGKPLKDRRLIVLTTNPDAINIEGVEAASESPTDLIKRLNAEGVKELAVCGGAYVYTQFMATGLVEELYINIMPKVFGQGVRLFEQEFDYNLTLIDTQTLDDGDSVMLHYKVI